MMNDSQNTIGLLLLKRLIPEGESYALHQEIVDLAEHLDNVLFALPKDRFLKIEKMIKNDLEYIKAYFKVIVEVLIASPSDVNIIRDAINVCYLMRYSQETDSTRGLVIPVHKARIMAKTAKEPHIYKMALLKIIGEERSNLGIYAPDYQMNAFLGEEPEKNNLPLINRRSSEPIKERKKRGPNKNKAQKRATQDIITYQKPDKPLTQPASEPLETAPSLAEKNNSHVLLDTAIKKSDNELGIAKQRKTKSEIATTVFSDSFQDDTQAYFTEAFFAYYEPEYTKEQVIAAVNALPEPNKSFAEKKWGLNGERVHTNSELQKIFNLRGPAVCTRVQQIKEKLIPAHLKLLDQSLESKIDNSDNKAAEEVVDAIVQETANISAVTEKFFAYYEPKYTRKQILQAVATLSATNKSLAEKKWGLNGERIHTSSELQAIFGFTAAAGYTRTKHIKEKQITRRLEAIDKSLESKIESLNTKTKEQAMDTPVLETVNNLAVTEEFFAYYEPEFTKEQVLAAVNALLEPNKSLAEKKWGLNGERVHQTKELQAIFGLKCPAVCGRIKYIKEKQIPSRLADIKNLLLTLQQAIPNQELEIKRNEAHTTPLPEVVEDEALIAAKIGFNTYKYLFRKFIAALDNPEEQMFLLMALGYDSRRHYYSPKEISDIFKRDMTEIEEIISRGLNNISRQGNVNCIRGTNSAWAVLDLTYKFQ